MKYSFEDRRVVCKGDCFIAPGARVIGSVILEHDASVWFNCVLRGDNDSITLGEGSNVQDGCVLHTDPGVPVVLERNVSVGHMAVLHGCTIGEGSLVGIKSVVLNRARIGKHCFIGANTLIGENKVIPDGVLVLGSPGRIVRALKPEEIEELRFAASYYQDLARRYRAGFRTEPE
ncbi:MAG: gamma carbonic anhydrase family protein [Burkholderiales bacterium]|nr:gamma carbonic anhydrase family protein [Burkholderiales bacterium]